VVPAVAAADEGPGAGELSAPGADWTAAETVQEQPAAYDRVEASAAESPGLDEDRAEEDQAEAVAAEEPQRSTRRRGRALKSLIAVNIDVPRGMGRRVNSKLIDQVVQLALQREGWQTPASLDVLIVDDEEMQEINATRRGIDEATDVLSFPLLDLQPGEGITQDIFVLPPEEVAHLGDVVISFSRVESQADEAGHSRERELAFLTVHAVLHILGYDHDTDEHRRQMRRREEEVLGELGLRRNGS
jgi:probable rRNA maturation factor